MRKELSLIFIIVGIAVLVWDYIGLGTRYTISDPSSWVSGSSRYIPILGSLITISAGLILLFSKKYNQNSSKSESNSNKILSWIVLVPATVIAAFLFLYVTYLVLNIVMNIKLPIR